MHTRRLGQWGLEVSAVGLGGWTTFGGSVADEGDVRSIVARALDGGVYFFDMADVYAHGEAERLMGRALRSRPRHELVLTSKVYFPMSDDPNDRGLSRKHVHASAERSLARIGTDHLDLYFAHRYDETVPLDEIVRAFSDLVDRGLVLYWGTSEWPAERFRDATAIARDAGWHPPAVEQPQYSLLARGRVERELFPLAEETGCGLVVWSPLAQGILTGKYDEGVAPGTRRDRLPQFTERLATEVTIGRVAREMSALAREAGLTRAQLALAWTLSRRHVSSAITGATRVEQLEENLVAADAVLDEGVVAALDALFPAA